MTGFEFQAGADELSGGDKPYASTTDRPDFKVRNAPYAAEPKAQSAPAPTGGDVLADGTTAGSKIGFELPTTMDVLAAVPDAEIVRYLERTDYERRLTAAEIAEKYLGAASDMPPDSRALEWMMMSDPEQRHARVAWFRGNLASQPLEEIGHYIDLRPYRVTKTLDAMPAAKLRKVEPPPVDIADIEKLKMPKLKPLSAGEEAPVSGLKKPKLRKLGGKTKPEKAPPAKKALPKKTGTKKPVPGKPGAGKAPGSPASADKPGKPGKPGKVGKPGKPVAPKPAAVAPARGNRSDTRPVSRPRPAEPGKMPSKAYGVPSGLKNQ